MRTLSGVVAFLFTAGLAFAQASPPSPKCPPPSRIDTAKDTYGTTIVADPYRWLEDQESPETRAWIESEQKCTEAALSPLAGRAALSKRLEEFYQRDAFQAPVERGGRYFYLKRPAGGDLSMLYIRRGLKAPEQVLIDPLPWSGDHSTSGGDENVSRGGKFIFYGRRHGGEDEVTMRVLDVNANK